MRTQESVPLFDQFPQNPTHETLDGSDDNSKDAIKEKEAFFNNSTLCQYYGENNIQKCLFLIFFLVVFSGTMLYHYYKHFSNLLFIPIVATIIINIISFSIYSYFLVKLKSGNMFESIPIAISRLNDILILTNFVIETTIIVLLIISSNIDWFCFGLFLFRYLIVLYFVIVSVKILMVCPGINSIHEIFNEIWIFFKTYILCQAPEAEQPQIAYQKIEDYEMESNI